MSDNETDEQPTEKEYRFFADRAKTGRANCKKCKQKIETKALRMAKTGPSPFGSGGGLMKIWHHVDCIFEVFAKQRATTLKIESVDDIGGWDDLSKEDQDEILSRFPDSVKETAKNRVKPDKPVAGPSNAKKAKKEPKGKEEPVASDPKHKDNSLREFRRLCAEIANVPGYLDKTAKVKEFITNGTDGDGFKGDLLLLIKLLLPGVVKRVYNLQSKQIVKLFSRLFGEDQEEMLESLEQGDVAETIRIFFEKNHKIKPSTKSTLTIQDTDQFLEYLSKLTREEDQMSHFASIASKCTPNDLKIIIRLIKHDLRIYAGAKHILDAVHENAYQAFQASRDLNSIIDQVGSTSPKKGKKGESLNVDIKILVPVLPMLAQACKSVGEAMKKCPNGMYSEIKYDGERVQVHKQGKTFKYYSRSLKPVLPHKIRTFEDYIPKAFPAGEDLILDSEILMIDTKTGKPLPFGSLGKHKKNEYQDANVCLFVFDCIYYNGKSLLNEPLSERKKILREKMKPIPFRILFSEMEFITQPKELENMMTKVFKQGLEGLVLKDIRSTYEPGKRHWLKVKKDYLFDGAMADSADLVVLGAWYGTGQKGGMMSVFLMGCYDKAKRKWCTVTKVHTGHDDETLARLQKELDMVKISKDPDLVPGWLICNKSMIPDFVAKDPKKQPVWEITGAELTKNVVHTADGISVRFPRVTQIRSDKNWETATNLEELKDLYKTSKETSDFTLSGHTSASPPRNVSPSKAKKRTASPAVSASPTKVFKATKYELKNPLPDVFVGMKICIPEDLPKSKAETLQRYFVAYGGEIVEDDDEEEATHKIVKTKVGVSEDCITLEEIWESIREKRLVPASG